MRFEVWRRTDKTPGHGQIYVYVNDDGSLPLGDDVGSKSGMIQCTTMDRIPFLMKRKDVEDRYQPEEK